MFEGKFRLRHRGCWTGGLARFKSLFVTHITCSLTPDFVQDVVEVALSCPDEARHIKKYFKVNDIVVRFDVLEETDKKLFLQVFTDTSKICSVVHTVLQNKCFVPKKVPLVDGWEIWTIAAPEKGFIRNALDEIKEFGDFELLYVKRSTFDGFNMSSQQEMVLKSAVALGYYRWPRGISAKELARRLGLSKATVLEHLRKAEIKVIDREFGV
ncbi:MAG: helix-turn-helix domain-containing protein [archaeon]